MALDLTKLERAIDALDRVLAAMHAPDALDRLSPAVREGLRAEIGRAHV